MPAGAQAARNNNDLAENEGNQFNMRQMAGRLRNFLETMDNHFPEANPANQENQNDDINDLEEFD